MNFARRLFLLGVMMTLTTQSQAQTDASFSFAVVGDTQRTMNIEKYLLGREQNDAERALLMNDISRQKIEFLVHVGDCVSKSTAKNWKYFDELVDPLKKNSIPILPLIGNHDVYGNLDHMYQRFPSLKAGHWYTQIHHGVQMIWLDSNKSKFLPKRWKDQTDWFKKTMQEAEANSDVKVVIVYDHHPPFTNSKVTGDEKFVQTDFLPAFYSSKKSALWMNGHVHSYEHFFSQGKHFVTSGGGGGPRAPLFKGKKVRHPDLFTQEKARPFNYVLIDSSPHQLTLTVRALDKGGTEVKPIDSFSITY